jgi:2-polyprenyl-6-methoxyphenol hydroxylase-like FAD-dependent oxidoreductase
MATTTRKKKKAVEEKILSPDEHRAVEKMPLVIENAKLLMALEEQALKNMLLELRLLEQKIEKQKIIVSERHSRYNSEKERYGLVIGDIMKSHKLDSEKFSYNNDTRLLGIDDKK